MFNCTLAVIALIVLVVFLSLFLSLYLIALSIYAVLSNNALALVYRILSKLHTILRLGVYYTFSINVSML